MAAGKTHIGKNGPAPCNAHSEPCPYEHFDTMKEAQEFYEDQLAEEAGGSFGSSAVSRSGAVSGADTAHADVVVSGENKSRISALYMRASDIDDTGLDIMDEHSVDIFRALANNDDAELGRAADRLNNAYLEELGEDRWEDPRPAQVFSSKVSKTQRIIGDKEVAVPGDLAERSRGMLAAADKLGVKGQVAVETHSAHITEAMLDGDNEGASQGLDALENNLRNHAYDVSRTDDFNSIEADLDRGKSID